MDSACTDPQRFSLPNGHSLPIPDLYGLTLACTSALAPAPRALPSSTQARSLHHPRSQQPGACPRAHSRRVVPKWCQRGGLWEQYSPGNTPRPCQRCTGRRGVRGAARPEPSPRQPVRGGWQIGPSRPDKLLPLWFLCPCRTATWSQPPAPCCGQEAGRRVPALEGP